MATGPLHVLLVEDSLPDAELITRVLRTTADDLAVVRVADEVSLRRELAAGRADIVLSDFSMPGFSGREALRITREMAPDTPFIFVSGTIGEELAIDALQRGASDYVLKDNLVRLPSAIDRALTGARERAARMIAERALRESEERYRAIVEHTDDWIWEIGADSRLTYSNSGIERILGWRADELLGAPILDHLVPADRDAVAARLAQHVADRSGWRGWVTEWTHRDGSTRTLDSNAQPVIDESGVLIGFRGVDRDVTERIAQQHKIRQLGRIQAVLGALGTAVTRARSIEELLARACQIVVHDGGFAAAMLVRETAAGLRVIASDGDPELAVLAQAAMATGDPARSVVLEAMRPPGRVVVAELTGDDEDSRRRRARGVRAKVALPIGVGPWGVLLLHTRDAGAFDADELALLTRLAADIDYGVDSIRKGERLEYLAYHNMLTGLPNRAALASLLEARLEHGTQTVAVFDVVNFHVFNDSRGREFSDDLLRAIAARLVESFGTRALVAHPGDDWFALASGAPDGVEAAVAQMQGFLEECSRRPFTVHGEHVYADLRCGLLQAPLHGSDADTIERNVMSALSEARNTGARLVVYDEKFSARAQQRVDLERELRVALERQQFELFLQPKFNARTQTLTGAEALIRWRHPERGLVSPAQFIPLLEETGMILPVGRWVLQQALSISSRWRRRGHGGLRLAINLSARELADAGFLLDSTVLLREAGSDHGIDVELTESVVMDDIGRSIQLLQALRDVGCGVAIDDYGTGYSSLNYLSRLPCDTLKIDRSFIADVSQSPEALALVTNTIGLAHSLGLRVVAEGVEDEEQAKMLRLLRCDEVQGYLFGRPVPVAEFEAHFIN